MLNVIMLVIWGACFGAFLAWAGHPFPTVGFWIGMLFVITAPMVS